MSTFRLANPTIILLSAAAMALIAAFAPGPFSLGRDCARPRTTHGQSAGELSGYELWARLGQRSMGGTARSGDHLFYFAIVKRLEC